MADLSKLRFNGTDYNVKDASAPARQLGNGYSKTGTLPISFTDTISEAIGKLENNIGSGGGGGVNTVYVGTAQYPPDSNGKVSLPAYPTSLPANGGTASNVSGTVGITHGGTGATSASSARSNLGLGSAATKSSTSYVTSGSSALVTSGAVYSSLSTRDSNIAKNTDALTEVVDSGAKNVLNFANAILSTYAATPTKTDTTLTVTGATSQYGNTMFGLPKVSTAGYYVISFRVTAATKASGTRIMIQVYSNAGASGAPIVDTQITDTGTYQLEMNFAANTSYYLFIYPSRDSAKSSNSVTITDFMMCTKAAFGVSNKFVPYKGNFITVPIRKTVRYNCTTTDYEHITALDFVVPSDTYVKVTASLRFSNGAPRGIKIIDTAISNPANAILAINEVTENYGGITTTCLLFNAGTAKTYAVYTKSASVSGNDVVITVEYLN